MRFILNLVIYVAIGAILASAGIGLADWRLYTVLTLAAMLAIIGPAKMPWQKG